MRCPGTCSTARMHLRPARCGWGSGPAPTRSAPRPDWVRRRGNYQATLAIGDRISTASAAASGPVAALTAMLYEHGIAVEMTAFHQLPDR